MASFGQFYKQDFELQVKQKYHGQKKTKIVTAYPKGGFAKVGFENLEEKQFVQFHYNDEFYEVSTTHLHGSIFNILYNDKFVVYLAECKKPTIPYYTAELGERYKNKRYPVLVCIDMDMVASKYDQYYCLNGKIEELPGITVLDCFSLGYIPWNMSLSKDTIYFTGMYHNPVLLGVVYCPNRNSDIFKIPFSLESSKIVKITTSEASYRSPMYCQVNDTLYYLSNPKMGPHFTNCQLLSFKDKEQVVVDTFDSKPYQTPSMTYKSSQSTYTGLYIDQFHPNAMCDQYLILDTCCESRQVIVIVDLMTTKLIAIADPTISFFFFGQNGSIAVLHKTSIEYGSSVIAVDLKELLSGKLKVLETYYHKKGFGSFTIQPLSPSMDIIKIRPATSNSKVIFYPHGGPHSNFSTAYSHNITTFLKKGYSFVLINFTGSTGYGLQNINELIGKIGKLDIEECYFVINQLLQSEFKSYNPYLMGGSHGGFISACLLEKYPKLVKACCMRNPVINLGLNMSSDIMDWAFNEMDLNFKQDVPHFPSPEEYEKMYLHSATGQNVATPTLVMIGKDDLRVPPFQGLRWVQIVSSYYNKCKAVIYADNGHSLDLFEADVYGHELILEWFNKHE